MPVIMFRPALAALAITVLVATGARSLAATVSFKAELNGASEVPPTQSKGTGSLRATLDTGSTCRSSFLPRRGRRGAAASSATDR